MMRSIAQQLLRFLFPWVCAHCRRVLPDLSDPGYCGVCWLALPRILTPVCRHCGLPIPDGGSACWDCRRDPSRILVRAAGLYGGALRSGILRFKFGGRSSLAPWFGRLLAQAWSRYDELHSIEAIVPVPLHRRRLRSRGYNQALLLAEELGRHIGKPVWAEALTRVRSTRPQTALEKPARRVNLRNAFCAQLTASQKDRSILLIDDVATTLSTLVECRGMLRRAGAASVSALILSRDPLPPPV